jgi:hypothetical protein
MERSKNPQDVSNLAWSFVRLPRLDLMEMLQSVLVHNDNKSLDPWLFTKTPRSSRHYHLRWCATKFTTKNIDTPLLQAIENRAAWMVFHGRPGEKLIKPRGRLLHSICWRRLKNDPIG